MNEKMKKYKKGGPARSSGKSGGGSNSNTNKVKTNVHPNRIQIAAAGGIQNARANANISASYAAKAKAVSAGRQVTSAPKKSSKVTYGPNPNLLYKPTSQSTPGGNSRIQKSKHKKILSTDTSTDETDVLTPNDYVGGGGGGYSPVIQNQEVSSIKIPEKDNVLSLTSPSADAAEITALVFEKLGAVELTKFTRTDTVEGNNPYYNIISNLSAIKKEFDPSNLISSQKSDDSLYNAFSIKLSTKIPGEDYLEQRSLNNYIFIDSNGSLVIELINITPDELIEIEIDTNGTIVEVR